MNPELPNLQIVPIENLLLHEGHDKQRANRLVKKIPRDKIFTNPPIVAKMPRQKNYVVLDGANRVTAVKKLGYPHLVVQIVDYFKNVKLEAWNHLVCRAKNRRDILKLVESNPAFASLQNKKVIRFTKIKPAKLKEHLGFMNSLHDLYENQKFYRVMGTDLKEFQKEYNSFDFLVVYPKFFPREIINIASNHLYVPSGITRHVIPSRGVGVDLDLKILRGNQTLAKKNQYLNQLIQKRIKERKVRVYQEQIVVFND